MFWLILTASLISMGDDTGKPCIPGDVKACSVNLKAPCVDGTRTCSTTGTWGDCSAEICDFIADDCDGTTPTGCEECDEDGFGDGLDNNHNGMVDESCVCIPSNADERDSRLFDHDNCGGPGVMCLNEATCVDGHCVVIPKCTNIDGLSAGGPFKASGAEVYFCSPKNGKKHLFPSAEVFNSWYPNNPSLVVISDAEMKAIPTSSPLQMRMGTYWITQKSDL